MQQSRPSKHLKVRYFIAAVTCLLLAGFLLPLFSTANARASRFIHSKGALLKNCESYADAQRVAQFARKFSDGTWVAVISEHACSSGAGFDATIFYDSSGIMRVDKTHHFCGTEGLENELSRVTASTLREFYAGLPDCKLAQLR